ncbi:MAG: ABC transporter ATP-binding protein/permease, partial [Lachnospiraceae bacterium]|nr:ABC transporter ATP-binding protein/permease [Ruminococcus sp.]MCM1277034.1 ABC transporter ATP-binding protein/permease [Lachnospiraceae bacterium]
MRNKSQAKKAVEVVKRCIALTEESDRGRLARNIADRTLHTAQSLFSVWLTSNLIDKVITGEPWRDIIVFILITGAVDLALFLVITTVNKRKNYHECALGRNNVRRLWEKLINMDYVHIEKPETHIAYHRVYEAYGRMQRTLFGLYCVVSGLVKAVAGIVMILPMMFRTAPEAEGFMGFIGSPWGLAAVLGIAAALGVFSSVYESRVVFKTYSDVMNDRDKHQNERIADYYVNSFLGNYRNGKAARIYAEEELILREHENSANGAVNVWHKALAKLYRQDLVTVLPQLLPSLLMYGFAALRAVSGAMSVGEIIGFVMYFTKITEGLIGSRNTNGVLGGIENILVDAEFLDDALKFLDIPDEKYKGTLPTEKRDDDEYEFEFRNVWFRYPNSEQYVLRGVDLKWRVGEKMALVGKNGCGKSTLVKLLCRLYDPTEGEITLNGIDIRKYKYEEYMALFSVVFQDSELFSFSVAENVAASADYDPGQVKSCVERAGLGERLARMENGIETCLYKDFDERGVEISGGEAQKLCLARAI